MIAAAVAALVITETRGPRRDGGAALLVGCLRYFGHQFNVDVSTA